MAVIAVVAATLMSAASVMRLLGLRGRVILLRRRSLRTRLLLLRLRTVLHVRSLHALRLLLWHRAVLYTRGFHAGLRLRLRLRPILSARLRLL
jgi:hypothetical protein